MPRSQTPSRPISISRVSEPRARAASDPEPRRRPKNPKPTAPKIRIIGSGTRIPLPASTAMPSEGDRGDDAAARLAACLVAERS